MSHLHIGTWLWGSAYPAAYVERLQRAVARNLSEPYTFHVWEPKRADAHLTGIPGCLARLRTFDPGWQAERGIEPGDRIVCLDLDLIVTGSLDGLFSRAEPFCILQGVNSSNPCRFNGSVWMVRAGYRPDVWSGFSVAAVETVKTYTIADDQRWFEHMMPDAGRFGHEHGVYAFGKPGWPKGEALPKNARIVAFPGHRDPSQFTHLDWVQRHWR